jgi:hypothetical protein
MIKWNEYTWYSKLTAAIFFIGILPSLTFYIGTQYEEVVILYKTPVVTSVSRETSNLENGSLSEASCLDQNNVSLTKLLESLSVIIGKPGATIDDVSGFLFTKFGPCWGIPAGQCRE